MDNSLNKKEKIFVSATIINGRRDEDKERKITQCLPFKRELFSRFFSFIKNNETKDLVKNNELSIPLQCFCLLYFLILNSLQLPKRALDRRAA